MIKVKEITIKEFRGIRDLTLKFNNNNFTVCGPNGTGKSGVVDALEFVLTGNVSRLSGEGTGDVSLKIHGPHVDSRNRPDKSKVSIIIFIPSLNKEVQIERCVDNISNPQITPNDSEVMKILDKVVSHPEFVLSRRELIRYIISKPGKRSEEVQALLRLNKIDIFRKKLNTVSNSYQRAVLPLQREKQIAGDQLSLALGITELKPKLLLEEVNKRRAVLSLDPIDNLISTTSLKDGLTTAKSLSSNSISKEQAEKDIVKINSIFNEIDSSEIQNLLVSIIGSLNKIKNDEEEIKKTVSCDSLFRAALDLIEEDKCPVCDTAWEMDKLVKLIQEKRDSIKETNEKCSLIKKDINKISLIIANLKSSVELIKNYGNLLKPVINVEVLENYILTIDDFTTKLDSFIPFSGLIESLENIKEIDGDVKQKINGISEAINKIPKPTEQDAARDYVVVAQEKFEHFKNVSIRHKRALEKASTIDAIYKKYVKVSDNLLNQLYKDVEKQFSAFYQELNKEDEGGFTAKLIPSIGKLGFDVDFYGKGFFPPGAYHSEGHQDAMGLCLYLTLMKHLSGDNFTFAVLDDVLMSVDTGHRREVCNLLKTRFPNTQFIFTTHDDIWLKHMKTVGLIESSAHIQFCKWDVDNGPIDWHGRDIWDEIEKERKNNNVQIASSLLRNYLEYISKEICHRLRAKVEFRGDALFQLGDLMPSATSRFKKILKDAKKAANSWSNTKVSDKISGLEKDLSEKIEQSNVEQWQINQAIHYNEWANFSKEDFKPVVNAYFNLLKSFECSKCKGSYYVIPERGSKEVLRCPCNDFNLNLQKKN